MSYQIEKSQTRQKHHHLRNLITHDSKKERGNYYVSRKV